MRGGNVCLCSWKIFEREIYGSAQPRYTVFSGVVLGRQSLIIDFAFKSIYSNYKNIVSNFTVS